MDTAETADTAFLKRKLEDAKVEYSKRVKQVSTIENEQKPSVTEKLVEESAIGTSSGDNKVPHGSESSASRPLLGRFTDLEISDLLFVEIFAGTARLSKHAREAGFRVLPVDKTAARSSQIYVAQYDLTDPDQFEALLQVLQSEKSRIAALHLAPACGTASKAREKKLTKWVRKGFKVPVPLRSAQKPMGVDKLTGLDKLRTELANQVYEATAVLVQFCIQHDIVCSVENPENSLFWGYPDIAKILETFGGYSTIFSNCMHGGRRNKKTKWWATSDIFAELAAECDNKHKHAQWNPVQKGQVLVFPTAEEAAYPHLLCKRIVSLVIKHVLQNGAVQHDVLADQLPTPQITSHRWVLDMLPKGKKLKPLVSEFQSYLFFLVNTSVEPEESVFFKQQPKGARVVQRQIQWGEMRVVEVDGQKTFWWKDHATGKRFQLGDEKAILADEAFGDRLQAELCTLGVPREPWDFVERAVAVGHPRSLSIHLSSNVMDMLKQNFSEEPYKLVKERAKFLHKWTERCKQLESQERDLHASLDEHLRGVLRGKRLLIFKEILEDLHYPDKGLVDEICAGFKLSGWLSKSNVFPSTLKRPSQSLESAQKVANGLNKNICKQVATVPDKDLAEEVWELTKEELERGWAWIDDGCQASDHLLAKRFGLKQGDKTRLIDDCSVGGFNSTCGASEKLKIHAIDEMAAYIAWCLTSLGEDSMESVLGKTYDLKNAYKQYGIAGHDRSLLRIAVWDPTKAQVRFLGLNALPFGAVGSVGSFLRIAMAVWYIGVCGLRLCWTSFFDDFTLLSKGACANSASIAAEGLFTLLGIDYAKDGKKAVAWDTKVKALGVVIDLCPEGSQNGEGPRFVTIGHTPKRIAELDEALANILELGAMSKKEAERLRGRLQWFESFAGGRVAQQVLLVLSKMASTGRQSEQLSPGEVSAVRFLKERVIGAPPTMIRTTSMDTWFVFSDGACEGEAIKEGSIGAVLVSPCGIACEFFAEEVPKPWMDAFLSFSQHPIFELELLPVWISLLEWEGHLSNAQCVFYLDNEAAKGALIKGATDAGSGASIVQAFVVAEMRCQVKVWFSRVPTSSNIADGPSRMSLGDLEARKVWRRRVDWNMLWARLRKDGSETSGFQNGILNLSQLAE